MIIVAALVVALTVGWAWDLPRRWLEGRLGSMLDADVRLAKLEFVGTRHFVLRGLEIREVRWETRVERIVIARLDVEASFREALNGQYERLTVRGIDLRLVPPARLTEPLPASELRIGTLELRDGRLLATSGAAETELTFEATLSNWGGDFEGRVTLLAERFDSVPMLDALGGPSEQAETGRPGAFGGTRVTADELRIDMEIQPSAKPILFEGGARRVRLLQEERTVELPQPRFDATLAPDPRRDSVRFTLRPSLAGIDSALLEAELDNDTSALRTGHVELRGVDIETFLAAGLALPEGWSVAGRIDLGVATVDGAVFAFESESRLSALALELGGSRIDADDVRVAASGTWRGTPGPTDRPPGWVYDLEATLGRLHLATAVADLTTTGSRLVSSGGLAPMADGPLTLRLNLHNGSGRYRDRPLPARLFPIGVALDGRVSTDPARAFLGEAEIRSAALGRVRLRGETLLDWSAPGASWNWQWSEAPDLAELQGLASDLGIESGRRDLDLRGHPRASGTLDGPLADPALRCRLAIDGFGLTVVPTPESETDDKWMLDAPRAAVSLARRPRDSGRILFDDLQIDGSLEHASGRWSSPVAVTAAGHADLRDAGLELTSGRIDLARLAAIELAGRVGSDSSTTLTAGIEPIELVRIRELSRLWSDGIATDFSITGALGARLDIQRSPDSSWRVHGDLDLAGAGFGSPDGGRVLEGVGARGRFDFSGRGDGEIDGRTTASLTGPLVLWGTWFADYSGLESGVEVTARRDPGRWEADAVWTLPGNVDARGHFGIEHAEPRDLDWTSSVDIPDLATFLDRFVRGPFEGSVARLDTLEAEGRLRVDLAGSFAEGASTVEGMAIAAEASFTGIDGTNRITGLDLDLPIVWNSAYRDDGVAPAPSREPRNGSLAYRELHLAGLTFPALVTPLRVTGDTIRVSRPLNLALLDGQVQLEEVALTRWSRPERDLQFGLRLEGLSLAALTRALDTFPLEGTLNGTFPAVRLTPSHLQVDGGGTFEIFGGEVAVSDISGEDILSRFPKLRFSADLVGLHLLDVTRTFDFGEIYGVVDGQIRDCELFAGAPVRCEASLATTETRGVPRKISVKAIRNISILGSGPRVGLLDRGLQKFLDTYTYSRLGLTMKLEQDRFLLRGTERRGDLELFVKGRLPFRIDIVNARPGQAVSFRTMMDRIGDLQVAPPERAGRKHGPGQPP